MKALTKISLRLMVRASFQCREKLHCKTVHLLREGNLLGNYYKTSKYCHGLGTISLVT